MGRRGPQAKDLVGSRFGRLVVESISHRDRSRGAVWNALCDCGGKAKARTTALRSGHTQSCGCLRLERVSTHQMSSHPLFDVWRGMIDRCSNKRNHAWGNYGGKGIAVCDRWLEIKNFISDMGDRPDGYTLDRIDTNSDYEPKNCRWATWFVQQSNRGNNLFFEFNGMKMTLSQWARVLKINYHTLYRRTVTNRWPTSKAFLTSMRTAF